MAEFVEQRARVFEAQKCRLAAGGLGEIADIDDQGSDVAANLSLLATRRHPGAAPFGPPCEVVAKEQTDLFAVRAGPLPRSHVEMPNRHVRTRRKVQTEQATGRVERRLDHAIEAEIRLD